MYMKNISYIYTTFTRHQTVAVELQSLAAQGRSGTWTTSQSTPLVTSTPARALEPFIAEGRNN